VNVTLEALIEQLESLDLSGCENDYDRLQIALNRRESAVANLQAFDMSTVTEGERARLKPRLLEVIERDRGLLARIEESRRTSLRGIDHVVTGRAVVRGYGAQVGDMGTVKRRVG